MKEWQPGDSNINVNCRELVRISEVFRNLKWSFSVKERRKPDCEGLERSMGIEGGVKGEVGWVTYSGFCRGKRGGEGERLRGVLGSSFRG